MPAGLARPLPTVTLALAAAVLAAGCGTVHNTIADGGDVYRFASEANKRAFDASPQRYAPAYAGFCASGAPYALKANIDADVFTIYRGRLYLFGSERVKAHWLMDADENAKRGDAYWENEMKDVPFRWQNFKRYTFKVPGYKTDAGLDAEYLRRFGKLPPGAPPAGN